jgi:hypothetical protein
MNAIACLYNREKSHAVTAEHAPEIRIEKVLSVRRQLGEGRYYAFAKLDVVIDRILEELLNQ